MNEKECIKCGISKPLDEFSKNSRNEDGKSFWCKVCSRAYQRQKYAVTAISSGRKYKPYGPRKIVKAPDGHKYCPRCEDIKPFSAFIKKKSPRKGYHTYCRLCNSDIAKDRRKKIKEAKQQ